MHMHTHMQHTYCCHILPGRHTGINQANQAQLGPATFDCVSFDSHTYSAHALRQSSTLCITWWFVAVLTSCFAKPAVGSWITVFHVVVLHSCCF